MTSKFTVLIDVYINLFLFKEAIEAIQNQTHENLEIIISDNGSDSDIKKYISSVKSEDKRIKIIRYEENIFSYEDPELRTFVLCNDALKVAEGDYIFYQSYDDLLANDYVERMVKLFEENPDCISAAGLPIGIDINGKLLEDSRERKKNIRKRHMSGHELALDHLQGGVKFSSPGTIFSFKKEELIRYGGFHRSVELSQLYGIVPFGETGFDEEAEFYWRRHEGQLNKELSRKGYCGAKEFYSLVEDFNLKDRWEIYGNDVANHVINVLTKDMGRRSASLTAYNFFKFNFFGAYRSFLDSISRIYFWIFLPSELWKNKIHLLFSIIKIFDFIFIPIIYLFDKTFLSKVRPKFVIKLKRFLEENRN